ncbi:MAG: DUF4249 family protein [Bacteroidia bacterium]|nr:DUF4249 family protein [Bacteroidia bacterium]
MKYSSIYILISAFLFLSCEEENLNNIAANQFVVEAFLYAGEPIDDIRIKTTFPLSLDEDNSLPINDAEVRLIKQGESYALIASGEEGYYHYPDSDLQVETGDVFQLEVEYDGILAEAETQVPSPTSGLEISDDTLFVPTLPFSAGRDSIVAFIGNFLRNSSIEASWDNPNGDLYFMVVESVSDSLDPIFPGQVVEALARFRFVSEPTDDSSLSFLGGTLESFGRYSVKVYHINQEYADLYENREQDSRDLNEPPSNISNALGVFSAFNSQERFFELARE